MVSDQAAGIAATAYADQDAGLLEGRRLAGLLMAARIEALASLAWAVWGFSTLPPPGLALVVIAALVAGGLFASAGRMRRRVDFFGTLMSERAQTGYARAVAFELAAIVVGVGVLAAVSQSKYLAAWIAFVVGVHFVGTARALDQRRHLHIAAAVMGAGIAGAIAGLAGADRRTVTAAAALATAAVLLAASIHAVVTAGRLLGRDNGAGAG
jgi:hypothetical protein